MEGMRRALRRTWAAALCLVLVGATPDAGMDPRLVEAARAYDEATKLKDAGKYAEAASTADRACSLWEAVLGPNHLEVAKCSNLSGDLHRRAGDVAGARSLLERGLAIREATLGPSHPDVAASLNNLGILCTQEKHWEQAEAILQRALAIRQATLGPSHPEVATTIINLANVFQLEGRYDLTATLNERALAIREAALGPTHPDVAVALNNLANAYKAQGLFERAELLHQRALAIREATLGPKHPSVGHTYLNLGNIYSLQGQNERAALAHEHALAIWEAALGPSHPTVAQGLNNLAADYFEMEQYDRAEALYRRSLAISESTFGQTSTLVAVTLNNLGRLSDRRGHLDEAARLFERALAIRESIFGKAHPDVAETLMCLADLHRRSGRLDQAEPLYERALGIGEAAQGKSHPILVDTLNGLALLQLGRGRLAAATPLLARALSISERRLRRETLGFSESRLASFLRFLEGGQERLYSLVRVHVDSPDARSLALTAALLFEGRSMDEAAATSRAILRSLGARDQEIFARLRGLRTRLARLSLEGPESQAAGEYQQELKALVEEGDGLEADLAKRSAPLRALTLLPSPEEIVGRVATAIPEGAAFVQFVNFTDHPLLPRRGIPESKLPAQPRYLAMVLLPDGRTGAMDLGPAAPIDSAASGLRDALAGQDAGFQSASRKLYQLAFKPLLPLLGKTRKLFVAADGQLALVPFAALHDGHGFLADAFDVTYLTSGRDLLPRPGPEAPSSPVVVFADPDYRTKASTQASVAERSAPVARFFSEQRGLSEQLWAPLPGTRAEAEAIHGLLPHAQVFVGAEASKERLLGLSSPAILHVASHGFFLEDAPSAPGGRGLGQVGGTAARLEDPLLRSGLVLAGASGAADLGGSLATALELAGLDLWGTQLVVLSACDTGRGEVRRGQGVYGLRRALVVAGAETVVVSLWKVDDETTRTMMEGYYRNLLLGQGRAEALKGAMLALRATHPHPHFWAPFIAIGRDAPLRALRPE